MVELPGPVCSELFSAALLLPLAATNLGAGWCSSLLATDASQYGEGVMSTPLDVPLARELWRHRDRRGAYTRLQGRCGEVVQQTDGALGRPPDGCREPGDDDLPFGAAPGPARILVETFDFIEICCGQRSPLVKG